MKKVLIMLSVGLLVSLTTNFLVSNESAKDDYPCPINADCVYTGIEASGWPFTNERSNPYVHIQRFSKDYNWQFSTGLYLTNSAISEAEVIDLVRSTDEYIYPIGIVLNTLFYALIISAIVLAKNKYAHNRN